MTEHTTQKPTTGDTDKSEIIFEIGGEGGSISIIRKQIKSKFEFIYKHNEYDFLDEDLYINSESQFENFELAFQTINNKYKIYFLYLLGIHNDYKDYVSDEFVNKLNANNMKCEDFKNKDDFEQKLNVKFVFDTISNKWTKLKIKI
jgi:hypothetical protein